MPKDIKRDKNEDTYMSATIVNHYAQLKLLQPAESTILERLREQLSTFKMLDIGVGGGRTTQHFAPLVETYTGIDYSAEMIEICRQKFTDKATNFKVIDARNMSEFADNSFDFILFSFNGIDYVSHGDRLKIFQEIKRIGKLGCYVFFSSHNLQAMQKEFDWKQKMSWNPLTTYVNLVLLFLLRMFNFSITAQQLASSQHLIIRDESHNFSLRTYYIHAAEQMKQLEENFNEIEIYSWTSGLQILDQDELMTHSDLWLYYFCRVK